VIPSSPPHAVDSADRANDRAAGPEAEWQRSRARPKCQPRWLAFEAMYRHRAAAACARQSAADTFDHAQRDHTQSRWHDRHTALADAMSNARQLRDDVANIAETRARPSGMRDGPEPGQRCRQAAQEPATPNRSGSRDIAATPDVPTMLPKGWRTAQAVKQRTTPLHAAVRTRCWMVRHVEHVALEPTDSTLVDERAILGRCDLEGEVRLRC
jgi:hypothetical protein